jgi:HAD superfamily hydrolase (TIGR01549 family)
MIKTILFDLDGTLLPIDEQPFLRLYFGEMGRYFASLGYNHLKLIDAVLNGSEKMRMNQGPSTNETVFWESFKTSMNLDDPLIKKQFQAFYEEKFDLVQASSQIQPLARQAIDILKQKGYQLVLATNPLFPPIATEKRIQWAGLQKDDFILITTYDNSTATKPSLHYYQNILNALNVQASECLMVGNDAKEDMAAAKLGIDTYLITDCLINTHHHDIKTFRNGTFNDFIKYIETLHSIH